MRKPPPEPPRISSVSVLAPKVFAALSAVLVEVPDAIVYETERTDARQRWLFGMGREWNDGRGIVTYSANGDHSWHRWRVAADLIHKDLGWDAPKHWWDTLGAAYEKHGLAWGGRWLQHDLPHGYWHLCKPSPSSETPRIFAAGGFPALWKVLGCE